MKPASRAILIGGGVAGVLDITYAILYSYLRSGVTPTRLLQSVASGVQGTAAFSGGIVSAALGLLLHFVMMFVIAAVYGFAARSLEVKIRPMLWGGLFGLAVYGVMNAIVVPLSFVPPRSTPMPTLTIVTGVLVHVFFIGLPIALAAHRTSQR